MSNSIEITSNTNLIEVNSVSNVIEISSPGPQRSYNRIVYNLLIQIGL